MPAFLTFIRQPFCVGFKISGHPGTKPYEFLTVNAHLNYGDPKHDPKQEFYALMDWIVARAGQEGRPYYENFILMGDLNLGFDDPLVDRERLEQDIKDLNKVTKQRVSVNFPFLDIHPNRNEVFRTNARLTQACDQIGLFTCDDRLPTYEANETLMGKNPVGPDFGVFNFFDLFQKALNFPNFEDLRRWYEHQISDHLPLWLRLPLP